MRGGERGKRTLSQELYRTSSRPINFVKLIALDENLRRKDFRSHVVSRNPAKGDNRDIRDRWREWRSDKAGSRREESGEEISRARGV